jgi:hypothetical protein
MKTSVLSLIFITIFGSMFAQTPGRGLVFDDEAYKKIPVKATLTRELYTTLPSYYSMKQYAPYPKSQGSYGTCTAWATAYAGMTILESMKIGRTDRELSTQNTFSPGFIYKHIKDAGDTGCKEGSSISEALELVKNTGVPKYTEMTEVNCPTSIPSTVYLSAGKYKITDYASVFGLYDDRKFKISSTKKSISQSNPVLIGMNTPDSFYYVDSLWTPTETTTDFGGHAMCVIGYDDDKFGGAFEIQNSWGSEWGNGGYVWIKYADYANFVKYAYEMIGFKGTVNAEKSFAGSLKFRLADGSEPGVKYANGVYKMNKPFKSGEKFRLYIKNMEPAYVYAFGTDATNDIFPVFPHRADVSAALTYSENEVALPDEDNFILVDNTEGTDYLCLIYSAEPLDIQAIQQKVKAGSGSFKDRVYAALDTRVVKPENANFSPTSIDFKATDKYKTAIAVIVETQHIK